MRREIRGFLWFRIWKERSSHGWIKFFIWFWKEDRGWTVDEKRSLTSLKANWQLPDRTAVYLDGWRRNWIYLSTSRRVLWFSVVLVSTDRYLAMATTANVWKAKSFSLIASYQIPNSSISKIINHMARSNQSEFFFPLFWFQLISPLLWQRSNS